MCLSNHQKDVSATEESDGARSREQEFGHVTVRLYTTLQAISNIYVFHRNDILHCNAW